MAGIRKARPDQQTCYRVANAEGETVTVEANKSAASRALNKLRRSGTDTAGWTLEPVVQHLPR